MKRLRKKMVQTALVLVLAGSMMIPASAATSVHDAKDKKQELENQLGEVQSQVDALKEQSESTQAYLDQLDVQLAELSNQLVSLEQSLETTQAELSATQVALDEAEAVKEKQYEDMKKRIKFMYESGDTAYLEMILEADDFTDMLNKADYVKAISEYDRSMLNEFQNTVSDIAQKKIQIQEKYTEIEKLKSSVEAQKETVESVTATKETEMANLKKEIAASEELKEEYEAEIEAQEDLIVQLEAEAARKAEEARRKAEEAKKKEALKNSAGASDSSLGSAATGDTSTGDASVAASSGWTWPCPGQKRITSEYGYRIHPTLGYNKLHNGIDVGAPTGTPIVAANSGTVIAAAYNSSMGNYIMIDHGGGIMTIYMHCSALAASSGDTVKSGQTIAYVGSTGRSTGPHLHFGVRVNGAYVSPWNYVSK